MTPTPTVTPTIVPYATRVSKLQQVFTHHLPPTLTPSGSELHNYTGISSVRVIPLKNADGDAEYYAVYSTGSRRVSPLQNHFVAIYSYTGNLWTQVSRVDISGVDLVRVGALKQVQLEPNNFWMQYKSRTGVHASCYHILQFNGVHLRNMVTDCSSSPNAGELRDLNGDEDLEIVINRSNDYVFCYECGLKIWSFGVWRCVGTHIVEVDLKILPQNASESIRELNNAAVKLAEAELWKDAQNLILQAIKIAPDNQAVKWNAVKINLIANARNAALEDSPYPILSQVFYGDYDAAVDIMREYSPEEIFNEDSPLLVDTIAEQYRKSLYNHVVSFSSNALKGDPDLASAYFLRGWVKYINGSNYSDVMEDLSKAADLVPADKFFVESVLYILNNGDIVSKRSFENGYYKIFFNFISLWSNFEFEGL
ncbi:hypothetical protein ACFLUC_01340 [Chloroflexota bacterium]